MEEKDELKIVDDKILAILKEHNCSLTINHVISINKIKPEDKKIEDIVKE